MRGEDSVAGDRTHGRIPGADSRGCGQKSKQGQIPGEGTELRGKEISRGHNSRGGDRTQGGERTQRVEIDPRLGRE